MVPAICKRAVLLWVFVLAACTIQLVPGYDQALVEGLDKTNTEALTLFAAVEGGSPKTEFGNYEEKYADVIGSFDALHQRASTRQVPPLAKRLARQRIVQDFCNSASDPASCLNVTPGSLGQVLSTLRRMRDTHKSSGLAPDIVQNFRNAYNPAIAQVLTVENALKR